MRETQSLEQFVEEQLERGAYKNYEEMLAAGLRLLKEKAEQDKLIGEELLSDFQYFDEGSLGVEVDADEIKRLGRKFLAQEKNGN